MGYIADISACIFLFCIHRYMLQLYVGLTDSIYSEHNSVIKEKKAPSGSGRSALLLLSSAQ